MNTKHTPGPWHTRRFDNEANGSHNFTVRASASLCEVARMSQVDQGVAEANACLIAAAPWLLEAATDAVSAYDDGDLDGAIIRRLRAAIAKATGTNI